MCTRYNLVGRLAQWFITTHFLADRPVFRTVVMFGFMSIAVGKSGKPCGHTLTLLLAKGQCIGF